MHVVLSTHLKGGFSRIIELEEGTSLGGLIERLGDKSSISRSLIRVNRRSAPASYILQPGDTISTTPTGVRKASCVAERLVAAGFAIRKPGKGGNSSASPDVPYDSATDPSLKCLRDRYAANTPEELDAIHRELEQAIEDNPLSFGTVGS